MKTTDAIRLANSLMEENGLIANGWHFDLDRATRRFGATYHGHRKITMSKALILLNDEKTVKLTILHEIAHALVGRGHGHDTVWKAKARELGHSGDRCYSAEVKTPPKKFTGTCPSCGGTIHQNRRTRGACAKCCRAHNHGQYSAQFEYVWTS